MREDIEQILLPPEEIAARVEQMGEEVSRDYAGKPLLVLGVLKGSFVFMADLVRSITIPCQMEFIAVSSYHAGVKSSGSVKMIKDIDINPQNHAVLLVEDILDSGMTIDYLKNVFAQRGAQDIRVAALLDKPSRRQTDVVADYVGFTVPDAFVVGYGLDYAELYRNLPYIGILKPKVYDNAEKWN